MQDITADPLVGLLEGRMDEALANGADVRELAALAIDAVLGEAVQLLEQHAAALTAGMGTCSSPVSVGPVGRHRQNP